MNFYGKHTHSVANRIVEAFKDPEQLPKALAPIFIHRQDNTPCRKWSWHNQLLVALSGTSDARGIRQWNDVQRKVKKGSSAIWILAPCLKTVHDNDGGNSEAPRQILVGFRSVPVFAREDTEGEPLSHDDDPYTDWVQHLPLAEVAEAWDIHVDTFNHNGNDPLGYFRAVANGNQAIMLGDERSATWLHELVHAAEYRLNALKRGEKWQCEVVAELGSAILMECLAIDHDKDLGGAYGYIAKQAEEAKMPVVRACIQVLDRTCNAVQHILNEAQKRSPATA